MTWPWEFIEHPSFYITFMEWEARLSAVTLVLGITCLFLFAKELKKSTRKLIIVNMTLGYMSQILTVTTIPVLIVPASAGYTIGPMNNLYISTCDQYLLLMQSICLHGTSIVLVFFDRYSTFLRPSMAIRKAMYGIVIIGTCFVPFPVMKYECHVADFGNVKEKYFQKMGPSYGALLKNETIAFEMGQDKVFIGMVSCGVGMVILMFGCIVFCSWKINKHIVQSYSAMTSMKNTASQSHAALVLLVQTLVYFILFVAPLATLGIIVVFQLPVPGVANLCFMIYSLSDPIGILVLIISTRSLQALYHKLKNNAMWTVSWFKNEEIGKEIKFEAF